MDLVHTVVFAACAAGVGAGSGRLQARGNNFAFERVHLGLRNLGFLLRGLLAGFQSLIRDSGQQLPLENFLAHLGEESSDDAFERRRDVNHLLGPDLSRQVNFGRRGAHRRRRRACRDFPAGSLQEHRRGDSHQRHQRHRC